MIPERIRDPFYSLDIEWQFTYVKSKCEEFFQKRREEMLGRNILEVFPEAAGTESERVLNAVAATRAPILFQPHSVIKDAWVEVHVFPKADGGLPILYRDIAERKIFEQELRSSEERFSAAFRGSPFPQIVSRVRDGVFLNVNTLPISIPPGNALENSMSRLAVWMKMNQALRFTHDFTENPYG